MSRAHILLAHGNTDCQVIYGSILTFSGYAVDIVDTVDAALQRLSAEHYDLVVSDLFVATIENADDCLVRRLRQSAFGGHLPAVVLTAWTTASHRHLALDVGADRFLPLPAAPRHVLAVIEELLEHGVTPNVPRSPLWDVRHLPAANGF